jgi:hypothetical protein
MRVDASLGDMALFATPRTGRRLVDGRCRSTYKDSRLEICIWDNRMRCLRAGMARPRCSTVCQPGRAMRRRVGMPGWALGLRGCRLRWGQAQRAPARVRSRMRCRRSLSIITHGGPGSSWPNEPRTRQRFAFAVGASAPSCPRPPKQRAEARTTNPIPPQRPPTVEGRQSWDDGHSHPCACADRSPGLCTGGNDDIMASTPRPNGRGNGGLTVAPLSTHHARRPSASHCRCGGPFFWSLLRSGFCAPGGCCCSLEGVGASPL